MNDMNNMNIQQENARDAVKHMSYSSLRSYLNNKAEFYQRYILREPMENIPVAMAVGSAVHKGIELYLKGKDPYLPKDLLAFSLREGQEIDYGKKNSLEQACTEIETALHWFHEIPMDWCETESEEGWTINFGDGLRIKGFVDAIDECIDGSHIMDFKTVGALSYVGENMAYFIQAMTYKMLAEKVGYDVKKASFIEIKKKPLKDRSKETLNGMVRIHEFNEITDEDIFALKELYRLAYSEIINNEQHYLPNLFAQYTSMEAWDEWKERVNKTL